MKRTCAGCGKTMIANRSSLPQGQATCQPCRRERNALKVPNAQSIEAPLLPLRITRPQASSSARGYGREHQVLRKAMMEQVATGTVVCCLCASLIEPDETWHLDHTVDRSGYRGAAHRICNLRDAQRRSAVTMVASYYGVERADLMAWLEAEATRADVA